LAGFDYGLQANDRWEVKTYGPHAFERSYTLEGIGTLLPLDVVLTKVPD